jgi:hypothetical protein
MDEGNAMTGTTIGESRPPGGQFRAAGLSLLWSSVELGSRSQP